MAKRVKKPEPAPHVEDEQDETNIDGFPDHGDEFRGLDPDSGSSTDDGREPEPDAGSDTGQRDPLAEFRQELASLRRQNEELHRALAANVAGRPEPKREEEEPDWEDLLFRDPKEALKQYGEKVAANVKKELRAEYQQVTRTEQFWNAFYAAHPDLKDDKDLVDATFNGNLNKFKDLPVDDAMNRLADLTRERIARYTGKRTPGKKVRVEGAGGPQPKPPPRQEATITTLSDLIRARRERRRKAATA